MDLTRLFRRPTARTARHFGLGVERLEDRTTPAVAFAPQQSFPVGTGTTTLGLDTGAKLAVADFDGDGRPDIVTSNQTDQTVSVLWNATLAGSPLATFAPQAAFPAGPNPTAVAVGDFNADNKPDLAVMNSGDSYTTTSVSVLLNTTAAGAAPSFTTPFTFAGVQGPAVLLVADVNTDGKPDILYTFTSGVFGNAGGGAYALLNTTPAGAAAPSFDQQYAFANGTGTFVVAAGDFNGDGKPDFARSSTFTGASRLGVAINTTPSGAATPSFAYGDPMLVDNDNGNIVGLAVADVNGDGRPDILNAGPRRVSFDQSVNVLRVLLNTTPAGGAVSFGPEIEFPLTRVGSLTAADVDRDGRPDVVITGTDGTVSVLLNHTAAGGAPSFGAGQVFAVGTRPSAAAAADFTGDGRPDLATANAGSNTASVLVNRTAAPGAAVEIPGAGLYDYVRGTNTLSRLTPADATLVARDAAGDIYAAFPGYGLMVRNGGGWVVLNGYTPTALAVSPTGDVYASFPGFGVGKYTGSNPAAGWSTLTASEASLLAADGQGDVFGAFPGYGLWALRPNAGWVQIHGYTPTALAVDLAGDVFAAFPGYGVGRYAAGSDPAQWTTVTFADANLLASDDAGNLVASLPVYGVARYPAGGGSVVVNGAAAARALSADGAGKVYLSFAGFGTFLYDPATGGYTPLPAPGTAPASGIAAG